jgi:hypothetical protein
MSTFASRSQAKQDFFVYSLIPRPTGTFLDIGSHDPIMISNTYALEKLGWTGYLFDIDPKWTAATRRHRTSPFILADVSTYNWDAFLATTGISKIDYLSFDVDEASLATLRRFPFEKITFNVMTVEHDRYRFGQAVADEMRHILEGHGYVILCKDITNDGFPYEDWYVHSSFLAQNPHIQAFASDGKEWTEVIKSIQTYSEHHS